MTALPTRKLEAFRYTDLRALAGISFGAPVPRAVPEMPALDMPALVFVNGERDAARSSAITYSRAFTRTAEGSALPLAQINAEHAQDGAALMVPAGEDAGAVALVSLASSDTPFAFHPRHRISLGEGARLTLIEIAKGEGTYWHNPVMDIALAAGARLTHIRLQDESTEAFQLATLRANIAEGAAYESFTAAFGSRLSRTETHATLLGPKAAAHLNAAILARGTQHADITSIVQHEAPGCNSRQTVKAVLADAARGVFQGRIEVNRVAQQTDGYQMTQALLLSERAEMDIKPELEIFADDVKCSHGATIGALDPEQIFYLRSRGIGEAAARNLLIRAFLEQALEPVTHAAGRAMIEHAIEQWWAR